MAAEDVVYYPKKLSAAQGPFLALLQCRSRGSPRATDNFVIKDLVLKVVASKANF